MVDETLYRASGKRGRGKPKPNRKEGATGFARQLRRLLKELGWNKATLARAAGVGPEAVKKWLAADRLPHGTHLRRLAKTSGYSVDWLLFGAGPALPHALHEAALAEVLESVPARQRATISGFLPSGPELYRAAIAHAQERVTAIRGALKAEDPRDHATYLLSVASIQDDPVLERRLRAWITSHQDEW